MSSTHASNNQSPLLCTTIIPIMITTVRLVIFWVAYRNYPQGMYECFPHWFSVVVRLTSFLGWKSVKMAVWHVPIYWLRCPLTRETGHYPGFYLPNCHKGKKKILCNKLKLIESSALSRCAGRFRINFHTRSVKGNVKILWVYRGHKRMMRVLSGMLAQFQGVVCYKRHKREIVYLEFSQKGVIEKLI